MTASALIETDTGKVVSAKSVKLFPDILNCQAKFVEPPEMEGDIPPVQLSLPDGTMLRSDSADVDRALSTHFKRNVTLRRSAPDSPSTNAIRTLKAQTRAATETQWSRKSSGRHCLPHLEWSPRFPLALS